ncbi:P13 family porin (plasmid) [Borreliella spielmanii]|uniref:Borrelia membrane protein P13 n=1 Tax=Borreliella spielmanii A14S TaxID=498742 RepID=C0RC12_9SPIR|nr:P13 family porin [Borreliella spielmanii]ACN53331.1 borrelia membrane protein P13 [Borreliella spielmanii A14S]WKC83044.1 P13 family porin [Borreliella spielmanii]
MKKIFTLILIFGLTIQIFSTQNKQDRIEKGIESFNKYEKEKKDPIGPFLLNLFLPFAIGSFIQGDYIGGGSVLGFNLLGAILWGTGLIFNIRESQLTGSILIGVGASILVTSYITSLIIPFTFANKHNENLKKRLSTELAGFEPNFDIRINGFQLSFKKSY